MNHMTLAGSARKRLPGSSFAFSMTFTGRSGTDVDRKMVVLILKSDVNDPRVKIRFTDLSRDTSGVMFLPASLRNQPEASAWQAAVMATYGAGTYAPSGPIMNAQLIYDTHQASNKP